MSLTVGTRLGPYEIVESIGAGGMGEVFRARDTRLDRDVALKVLPTSVGADPDRLQRFEQEARASAALNHPNILVVHDVGTDHGIPYVVSELLQGHTLRHVLETGAVPPRKAIDYAIQIANGLAAAHERGIVHRDLKPENVFVTKDGRAKILDFGLAKLVDTRTAGLTQATALSTDPGTVLGTAGYMSPEQLRGETVDQRSDIFGLGAILYELFSGERAFRGKTAVETMSAILKEDPPELGSTVKGVSPAIERVIRRCLEKNPAERFQSARDVTFALDAVSSTSSAAHAVPAVTPERRVRPSVVTAATVAAIAAAAVAAYAIGARVARGRLPSQPIIKQLTFRSGTVRGARFTPDGKTVIYGAAWEGRPIELYTVREQNPESSAINLVAADLLAVSSAGEMAVSLKAASRGPFVVNGTLARAPLAGGAARELLESVASADWSADGKQLAVIRVGAARSMSLEYPVGTELFSAPFWLSSPRMSPDGTSIAFISHPQGGDEGSVELVDVASRQKRTLSAGWLSIDGLAWAPDGREVWFTATKAGSSRSLWAVSLAGVERSVFRAPRRLMLQDIASDGRVLLTGMTMRSEVLFGSVRDGSRRNLSWFDWATGLSLSADSRVVAFTESGEGAGEKYGVYIRPTDGSPAVRLGDGSTRGISPDGKWVASANPDHVNRIVLLPTGAGSVRTLDTGLENLAGTRWFPDSRRLVFIATEKGHKPRTYELSIEGGAPKPITPEGITGTSVSPDGRWLAANGPDGPQALSLAGAAPRRAPPAADPTEQFGGWLADSRSVLLYSGAPAQVTRMDIESGTRTPVATVGPSDPSGVVSYGNLVFAPDGDHYVFNYFRVLSELYIVDGLR